MFAKQDFSKFLVFLKAVSKPRFIIFLLLVSYFFTENQKIIVEKKKRTSEGVIELYKSILSNVSEEGIMKKDLESFVKNNEISQFGLKNKKKVMKFIRHNNFYVNTNGEITIEKVSGGAFLTFLYSNFFGKQLNKILFLNRKSILIKMLDYFAKSKYSINQVKKFLKVYDIDLSEFEGDIDPNNLQESFNSFNDFFLRKLKNGSRTIDNREDVVISPADSKLYVIDNVNKDFNFFIKRKKFSLESFLKSEEEAKDYEEGTLMIFRLAPNDYHRFHAPYNGNITGIREINTNVLQSVNPIAIKSNSEILSENERKVVTVQTEYFDECKIVVVGAMMVGRIKLGFKEGDQIEKGKEIGFFEYGGSTVVLLFKKNMISAKTSFLKNSLSGLESEMKVGEQVNDVYQILLDDSPEDLKA